MREFREPLSKRMLRSAWFKRRYRADESWRLGLINQKRAAAGKPLAKSLPPVGEAKRVWANGRKRDDKGRWLPLEPRST